MFYETAKGDHGLQIDPFKAVVVPRPIGWASTVDKAGNVNLAPFSFYNGVGESPPMVMFAPLGRYGSSPAKHSLLNCRETGEFVINMVSEALKDQMNVTAGMVEMGVDEMKLAGLTAAPSRLVKPPRVAESPVALECRVFQIVDMPVRDPDLAASVVIGEVVGIHIDESILKNGRVDVLAFRPVARLGYSEYTTVDNVWRMKRPG